MLVVAELHCELNDAPDPDGDQTDTTNASHNLLQIGNIMGALLQQTDGQVVIDATGKPAHADLGALS